MVSLGAIERQLASLTGDRIAAMDAKLGADYSFWMADSLNKPVMIIVGHKYFDPLFSTPVR